jgi:hypothetical protein
VEGTVNPVRKRDVFGAACTVITLESYYRGMFRGALLATHNYTSGRNSLCFARRMSWREDVVERGCHEERMSWREDIVERGCRGRSMSWRESVVSVAWIDV